jgi:Zn-dependent peptidase ImmA (M78 family)
MNYREAILNGTKAAAALHDELGTKQAIHTLNRGNIDVFSSILSRGASLVFRPLDGLLGACLHGHGVIISTNRPLPVQRFTAAHELGHIVLNHSFSLDGEEILAGEIGKDTDIMELEANAFAGEFLLPRWVLAHHARRQGWNAESMQDPSVVYQLSLRAGASYEATAWSLERHKIIDRGARRELLQITPKTIKQKLLPEYSPDHWYRDVWLITEKDEGASLEGQPNDVFLFRLSENTGAGYLWDIGMLKRNGFMILSDQRLPQSADDKIGAAVTRVLAAHSPAQQKGRINLALRRPWQPTGLPAGELKIEYNLLGKERGLPRAKRPEVALAA